MKSIFSFSFTPRRSDAARNRTFVMVLHYCGLTDHDIAQELGISVKTVYRHRQAEDLPVNRARWGSLNGRLG